MGWLIPILLFVAALTFWRLSHKAADKVVAWCRFLLAVFLSILALVYTAAMLASGY